MNYVFRSTDNMVVTLMIDREHIHLHFIRRNITNIELKLTNHKGQ